MLQRMIIIGLLLFCGSSLFASPNGLYDVLWWKWFKTYECRFTPDDSKIYVNGDSGVGIFDTKTGNQDTIISGVWFGNASYDGTKYYKVENGVIKEYDFLTLKHIRDFDMKGNYVKEIFISPNKYITSIDSDRLSYSLWDSETGQIKETVKIGNISVDGINETIGQVYFLEEKEKILVSLTKWKQYFDPKQGTVTEVLRDYVKILNSNTKETINEIETIFNCLISKKGNYLVGYNPSNDGKTALKVYSIDGELLFSVPGWASSVSDIDFSIDDRFMLVSFSNGGVQIWDFLTKQLKVNLAEKATIYNSKISNDLKKLITTNTAQLYLMDIDGISSIETNNEIQATITYPNPSSTELIIEFSLSNPNQTKITINDLNGKQIKEVFNSFLNEGLHKQNIDLRELQTGTYYLRIQSGNEIRTEKIVVVR